MFELIRPTLVMFAAFTLITGGIYPLVITLAGNVLFPDRAAGSLIMKDHQVIGSRLIGQYFDGANYFWSRPSATAPNAYNAGASGGSNLGPLNPALLDAVKQRVDALKVADPHNVAKIPVDLVTASASGLDPHISVAAALYQADRVAQARGIAADKLRALIAQHTEDRALGFLGEPRVNVLDLNLALDALHR